jgi:transcription elongation GreA/GreB family factor
MRVPIRKSEKYTYLPQDPYITPAKFEELRKKLDRLINVSRPRESVEVQRLAMMGDFSENVAYQVAKGRLRGINQRILDIGNLLKKAVIIQPDSSSGVVEIGQTVTVEHDGRERTYQILGSEETDPTQGIISHNSPLGSALLGHRCGDTVTVTLTDHPTTYKIKRIA